MTRREFLVGAGVGTVFGLGAAAAGAYVADPQFITDLGAEMHAAGTPYHRQKWIALDLPPAAVETFKPYTALPPDPNVHTEDANQFVMVGILAVVRAQLDAKLAQPGVQPAVVFQANGSLQMGYDPEGKSFLTPYAANGQECYIFGMRCGPHATQVAMATYDAKQQLCMPSHADVSVLNPLTTITDMAAAYPNAVYI